MCDRHAASRPGNPLGAAIQGLFRDAPARPAEAPARADPVAGRRLRLWELEDKHHCPVVGTCLNLDELKKVARKGGFAGLDFDEYRLHVEAVSISCGRNDVSEAMHKLLDRKYALILKRFDAARTDAEVRVLWKQHLDRGEVAGAMWAALTHKAAGPDTRQRVYADVHMLSHQIGAGQAADLRRLQWLERENAGLRGQLKEEAARRRIELAEKNARIRQLEEDVGQAWERAQAAHPLKERLEALESGVAMTGLARRLLAVTDEAARRLERNAILERRLAEAEAAVAALEDALETVRAERDALESLWPGQPDGAPLAAAATGTGVFLAGPSGPGCDGACGECSSSWRGRCVLCVGGRVPLLPQYRQLAERLGVRLIHHDGGREESLSRLPALLASSDAVICPTDCVGHLAYYQLKQHCKQASKPCLLVKSSGVASFAAALSRLARGQAETRPE